MARTGSSVFRISSHKKELFELRFRCFRYVGSVRDGELEPGRTIDSELSLFDVRDVT